MFEKLMMNTSQEKLRMTGSDVAQFLDSPFRALVSATRTPMVVTNPRLPDNPIVYANSAFTDLCGYQKHEIVGKNCRFLQGEGTDRLSVERLKHAIAANEEIEVDLLNYRKDGSTFWNRLLVSPVFEGQALT